MKRIFVHRNGAPIVDLTTACARSPTTCPKVSPRSFDNFSAKIACIETSANVDCAARAAQTQAELALLRPRIHAASLFDTVCAGATNEAMGIDEVWARLHDVPVLVTE